MVEWVVEVESVVLEVKGVINFNGVSGGWGWGGVVFVISEGFVGVYLFFLFLVLCLVLVGEGFEMEMGYDYYFVFYCEDFEDFKKIGVEVVEWVFKVFNFKCLKSGMVLVVYENWFF